MRIAQQGLFAKRGGPTLRGGPTMYNMGLFTTYILAAMTVVGARSVNALASEDIHGNNWDDNQNEERE